MTSAVQTTARHWSEHATRFSGRNAGLFWWEAGTEIQRHINYKISGKPDVDWVTYTLSKYFSNRLPLGQCLSLGCGSGQLERTLARLGAFSHCDAYDVAEGSIEEARKLAQAEGIRGISYYVSDINKIQLPAGLYDGVWIHGAMHHFKRLEHVCERIKQSLKPNGLLILQEYVGPSRFQFPARQKEIADLCLRLLPAPYRMMVRESITLQLERTPFEKGFGWFASRVVAKFRGGDLIQAIRRRFRVYRAALTNQGLEKTAVVFPSPSDVISADPSEAVRSAEIVPVLQQTFEIMEKREWGGNIIQFLLEGIAGNFNESEESRALLRMLLEIEDTLLQCGEFESDYAFIVARPLNN